MDYIEALAEAWASIDGKLFAFKADKDLLLQDDGDGSYEGYMAEAKEMTNRLAVRGFKIVPIEERE